MYKATVCKLKNLRPHPNADRLQIAEAAGNTVVVGINTTEHELGVYFPSDGQLSEEYCSANDLVRRKDENGKTVGGFFEENRRVKNISLRGVKTTGYWAPTNSLYTMHAAQKPEAQNVPALQENDQIDSYDGIPLCQKYLTKATRRAREQNQQNSKIRKGELHGLKKHYDTHNIKHHFENLAEGEAFMVITEKLHGTSGRFGHCKVETKEKWPKKMNWLKLLFYKFMGWELPTHDVTVSQWKELSGSRNIVLSEENQNHGYYGSNKFRHKVVEPLKGKLHKGETVYFEIVGYTDTFKPIMGIQNIMKLKDSTLQGRYGSKMEYKYGCSDFDQSDFEQIMPKEKLTPLCKMYVYRISRTSEDGVETELNWFQVKARCKELGVETVPELYSCITYDPKTELENLEGLGYSYEDLMEGDSTLDSSHIREGICIRIEYSGEFNPKVYKAKSWTFGALEGYLKVDSNYIDTEEIS